ncbi:hypothetical protein [Paraburkholderia sp. J10-1]|uniref:hypothetical protein n=1 Tax=Paraburkholderia sp. J10-1 TaxID=2805430 RepID=UPI002AB5F588|nr:hypothetical protein [Paraburkholderia sp. J10-1]
MSELMRYLHVHGPWDFTTLLLNGAAAVYIVLRLVFADIPKNAEVSWTSRLWKYAFVAVYTFLALRIGFGLYKTPVDPGELLVNQLIAAMVWRCRGDLRIIDDALARAVERWKQREQAASSNGRKWPRKWLRYGAACLLVCVFLILSRCVTSS